MRILVTGGTGAVGRTAVIRLVRGGHAVRVIGRRGGVRVEGAEYSVCDISDPRCLADVMRGVDAVVHLAAIANPGFGSGPDIYAVNCAGTFNVYTAAARAGIRRVVQASSINALGYNFGVTEPPVRYFPVDEEHPAFTTDPYSFSKTTMEKIAAYFWARDGISGVSLRLPWVFDIAEGSSTTPGEMKEWFRSSIRIHQELLSLPPAARTARARSLVAKWSSIRAAREFEKPFPEQSFWSDPDCFLMVQRSNFWALLDARDSAQAVESAVTKEYDGSRPLFITDPENASGVGTQPLIEAFFPEVKDIRQPLEGSASLVSTEAARRLLGFQPEYSFRQLIDPAPTAQAHASPLS